MADHINNFFVDIGGNLASEIPDSLLEMDLNFKGDYERFCFRPVTEKEVQKLLRSMSVNKSTGVDGIPIRFLKICEKVSVQVLTHIINLSLSTMTVPNNWKLACVVPLFKEGDKTVPGNYRPIAILPAASKILERVSHNQVMDCFTRNKLLSDAQFGFRKGHSTTSCIMNLLNDIYISMDNKQVTGVVFLDLKKAFDTVDHGVLLRKLHMYGLDANSVAWFNSYLSGRYQQTKVNGSLSKSRHMSHGVPQGSILGPLLFIIYINDLSTYLSETKTSLYADDTAIYCSSVSAVEVVLSLRMDLSMVTEWLRANKLTLNTSKTKYMFIGSKPLVSKIADQNISMGGASLERVQVFKYLGLWLDENLTFDFHVNKVYNKACQRLGAI